MIALVILLPVYLLALYAIIDALTKPAVKLCGQTSEWRLRDASVTDSMKSELIKIWISRKALTKIDIAKLESGIIAPLFGWGYAYQYQTFTAPNTIEVILPGERYTITSESDKHIKQAMKVIASGIRDLRKRELAPCYC
jgi:hypothetical protein